MLRKTDNKLLLDRFDIGDLVSSGIRIKPIHGIVIKLKKHNYPISGLHYTGVKIKWLKHTGEIREMWYLLDEKNWWIKKIVILAKARRNS